MLAGEVLMVGDERVDHFLTLLAADRTDRIDERAAWLQLRRAGAKQLPLLRGKLGDLAAARLPAQVGPRLQRAEPTTRGIDEHAVESLRVVELAGICPNDPSI